MRILLVEDNEINQQIAVELLQGDGAIVDVANNGIEAVDMADPALYDLVLMDLQMPLMDGYTATVEIRSRFSPGELPVLAMTADAITGVEEKCRNIGMQDFISKPVDHEILVQTILKWVKVKTGPVTAGIRGDKATVEERKTHIPFLENVNVDEGLLRLGGNRTLYLNLLRRFAAGNRNIVEQVTAALGTQDFETAHRLVHTIKGISGTLGASSLHRISTKLDDALKEKSLNLNEIIQEFSDELIPLLAELDEKVGIDDSDSAWSSGPEIELDREHFLKEVAKLRSLIEEADIDATKMIEQIIKIPGVTQYQEKLGKIREKLRNFDHEAALHELAGLDITGKQDIE